MTMLNILIAL